MDSFYTGYWSKLYVLNSYPSPVWCSCERSPQLGCGPVQIKCLVWYLYKITIVVIVVTCTMADAPTLQF
jgi:hypothetical protein